MSTYFKVFQDAIRKGAGTPPKGMKISSDPSKTSRKETRFNAKGAAALWFTGGLGYLFGARATKKVDATGGQSADMISDREQSLLNGLNKAVKYHQNAAQIAAIEMKKIEACSNYAAKVAEAHAKKAEELAKSQEKHFKYYMSK